MERAVPGNIPSILFSHFLIEQEKDVFTIPPLPITVDFERDPEGNITGSEFNFRQSFRATGTLL